MSRRRSGLPTTRRHTRDTGVLALSCSAQAAADSRPTSRRCSPPTTSERWSHSLDRRSTSVATGPSSQTQFHTNRATVKKGANPETW